MDAFSEKQNIESRHSVSDLYPKKKKKLTGADRIFCCSLQQKRLNTICTFFWIWVAVLLQRRPALCLSPRTQLTSVRGPPLQSFSLCFTSSHIVVFTTFNISITVKRNRTRCIQDSTKRGSRENLQILLQSATVFLSMDSCFFQFVSKMVPMTSEGADVFTQLCRAANTVTQLNKPPHRLLADRSSASTRSRHNISALQLISVNLKDCSSSPELHLQSQKTPYQPLPLRIK